MTAPATGSMLGEGITYEVTWNIANAEDITLVVILQVSSTLPLIEPASLTNPSLQVQIPAGHIGEAGRLGPLDPNNVMFSSAKSVQIVAREYYK